MTLTADSRFQRKLIFFNAMLPALLILSDALRG
jgi:hypothetical protein